MMTAPMFWPTRDAKHAGILDIGLLGGAIYDPDRNSWKFARESEGKKRQSFFFPFVFLVACFLSSLARGIVRLGRYNWNFVFITIKRPLDAYSTNSIAWQI